MKLVRCDLSTLVRRNFLAHVLTTEAARRAAIDGCPCPKHVARRRKLRAQQRQARR